MKNLIVLCSLILFPSLSSAQVGPSNDARGYEGTGRIRLPWEAPPFLVDGKPYKPPECPSLSKSADDQAASLEAVLDLPLNRDFSPSIRACLPVAEKLRDSGKVSFLKIRGLNDSVTRVKNGLKVKDAVGSCVNGVDVETKGKILDALAVVKDNGDASPWTDTGDRKAYESLKERIYVESVKNALDQYYILGKKYGQGLESGDPIHEICRAGCTERAYKALAARLTDLKKADIPKVSFEQTAKDLNDTLTKELRPAAIAYNNSTSEQLYGNANAGLTERQPTYGKWDSKTGKYVGPRTKDEAEENSSALYSRYRSTYWHITESEHGVLLRTDTLNPLVKVEPKPTVFMSDAWRVVSEKPQVPNDPNYIRRAVMDAKAMIAEQTGHLNDLMKNGSWDSEDLLNDLAKLTRTNPAAAAQVMMNNPALASKFCPILTQSAKLQAQEAKSKFWWSTVFIAGGIVVSLVAPPLGGAIVGGVIAAAPLVVEANQAYSNYQFSNSAFFVTHDSARAIEAEQEHHKFVVASVGAVAAAGSAAILGGILSKAKTVVEVEAASKAMANVTEVSAETGGAITPLLESLETNDAVSLVMQESKQELKRLVLDREKNPSGWQRMLDRVRKMRQNHTCGGL